MIKKLSASLIIFSLIFLTSCKEEDTPMRDKPAVGVIRWDAWFDWQNEFTENLKPQKWKNRWPFFTQLIPFEIKANKQEIMDQEIIYASSAGLSYFAFVYYHGQPNGTWNNGLELYLQSKNKSKIGFALLLQGSHLGNAASWETTVESLKNILANSSYQKIPSGRKLVFIYDINSFAYIFNNSNELIKEKLGFFKKQLNAYVVAQVWDAITASKAIYEWGFDAAGSYSNIDSEQRIEKPYNVLANANQNYWEACRKNGLKVLPTVSTGWDPSPRWERQGEKWNKYGVWYSQATPLEIAQNLKAAIDWNLKYPQTAEANSILIYAWNEFDEGGWLAPTLEEGSLRLNAISQVLK